MSQVRSDVDLAVLARTPASVSRPRRSPWRILLPLMILGLFAVLLATSLRGVFATKKEVTVVRPRTMEHREGGVAPAAAQHVLLQAAGWVEPDPFAIQVTALTAGVVREVLVLEAEAVEPGQVIARLIDDDARLALAASVARAAEASADLAEARAGAAIAQTRFERALEVTESEAAASAEVEGKRANLLALEAAVRQAGASLLVERDELALQKELESVGAGEARLVELADARVVQAESALAAARAAIDAGAAELRKAQAIHARAKVELELRLDDRLALETARAREAAAEASLAAARADSDEAELRLARTAVVAPVAGIVLERLAMPGTELSPGAASVCTLFDPAHLRVRVDVPQGDVAKLAVGGRTEISTDARAGTAYHGVITRLVQKADIQKVTLQVHVRIDDGDEWLRPEMLAKVKFLSGDGAGAGEGTASSAPPATRIELPLRVVEDRRHVWVVDGETGTAARRTIELGGERGEWVEVLGGLDLSAKVIDGGREGLEEGDRLAIREQKP